MSRLSDATLSGSFGNFYRDSARTYSDAVSSVGCRSDWRTNFPESDAIRSLFSSLGLTAILRSGQHSVRFVSAKAVLQILATFWDLDRVLVCFSSHYSPHSLDPGSPGADP